MVSGWWLSPTPLKNDGVKVSWDDDIPIYEMEQNNIFQNTNQSPNPVVGLEATHMFRCGYYGGWKKSCTSWQVVYPIIFRVSTIQGGAGFLPSTVCLPNITKCIRILLGCKHQEQSIQQNPFGNVDLHISWVNFDPEFCISSWFWPLDTCSHCRRSCVREPEEMNY